MKNKIITECLYDERYYGSGILITQKEDNEIIRFLKLSEISESGFPNFMLHGYEKSSKDSSESDFRRIDFVISKTDNEILYEQLKKLALGLRGQALITIDRYNQGKNRFIIVKEKGNIKLSLIKDVFGVKNATDFIDIAIGDNYSCDNYEFVYEFYRNLNENIKKETNEKTIRKILSI